MAQKAIGLIQGAVRGRTVLGASLRELTTLRVGGPAEGLVYPADREDLAVLLRLLRDNECPCFVMGNGSNLVVRDAGIRGAVVNLEDGFTILERREDASGGPTLSAEAGVPVQRLVRWTADEAVAGFEFLAGIPGCVGGALAMNAGLQDREIGSRVLELEVMDREGRIVRMPRSELRLGYRKLELPEGAVILSALLQGERSSSEEIKEKVREHLLRRSERQPVQEHSAGCVFKNPPGDSAGRLIDECGLKGVRVGDAEVSRIHANFIVNVGSATAGQVLALMGMIQERVYVKFKVRLEPEVIVVGEWEKGKLRITE